MTKNYAGDNDQPFDMCCESQDSNRFIDFLMAENSNVDNCDMLRRSSAVSSKTTKTKNNADDYQDKVIMKQKQLLFYRQTTETTNLLPGIEDKVIVANGSQGNNKNNSSNVDDKGTNVSQVQKIAQNVLSEAYSLGNGSCVNTEQNIAPKL